MMMSEMEIIEAIEQRVMSAKKRDYSIWTVGITDDPNRRKMEHDGAGENTQFWLQWKAIHEIAARNVERHFLHRGMKGGSGGGGTVDFVYIF